MAVAAVMPPMPQEVQGLEELVNIHLPDTSRAPRQTDPEKGILPALSVSHVPSKAAPSRRAARAVGA